MGILRSAGSFPPPPFTSGTGEATRTTTAATCSLAGGRAAGRIQFPGLWPQHPTHISSQEPVPYSAPPACSSTSRSVPAGEMTECSCWWSKRNGGQEERNGFGGKPGRARTNEPGPGVELITQRATQKPFTSDSRQDMNFKTTCLRYSKLISRASVRSALFVTEGAMFVISGPGFSRTSKSSLSGLIF